MPRAIWSGSIAFGLVNAPVRMYPAIAEHDLELHLVHEPDGSRIGYAKICKEEQRVVPDDEIVKAHESRDGKLVYLTDEDFEAAQEEGFKTIDILEFVPYDQIDPIYFERTYYLGPDEGAEKAYALLVGAMEKSELVAIARYVFHDRQRLGCLRVRDGILLLERLYFADEIRPADGITPARRPRVAGEELDMALELIERFTGAFDPSRYEDEYRARLLAIVRRKRQGKEVRHAPAEEREPTTDLVEALRASVEQAASRSRRTSSRSRKRTGGSRGGRSTSGRTKPRSRKTTR
jgi:DNA end-binding protein Ku